MNFLVAHYPAIPADEFTPLMLESLQKAMIAKRWRRSTINKRIGMIKRTFKWAVRKQRVPASVAFALQTVDNLLEGRSDAEESRAVEPVEERYVLAVLPYATHTVAAMMEVQLYTGMRSTELCMMRPMDINRSNDVWLYTPTDPLTGQQKHKTAYKGVDKKIAIGPKTQGILLPFLLKCKPDEYIFKPSDSMADMRERRHEDRQTPMNIGNTIGTHRQQNPQRTPGEMFNKDSYGRAVKRAIRTARKAGVETDDFHPHQLRHTAATKVRQSWGSDDKQALETGLQAASALLGHKDINTTQLYAELNKALAIEAARRFG